MRALLIAIVVLSVLPAAATAAEPAAVPGEIVVGFRPGAERAAARSAGKVQVKRSLATAGVQLVTVESGQSVDAAIKALEQRADVRYAEPNWIYQASSYPDDPFFSRLWGLENTGQVINGGAAGTADADIDAPEAWDHNRGSASTIVAVVDTGVAWDHPDLAPNMWTNAAEVPGNGIDDDHNGRVDDVRGWDFVDADNDPWDTNDHGTHVAGTIAARGDNGIGTTGVAWRASIMPVRVLDTEGSGTNANIADGFTYAAVNGAKVVNASLGGSGFSQAMSDAISTHPNTLFVVAAGNGGADGIGDDNDATPTYPCNYAAANLVCVAATNNNDALAGFSNFGATSVDLAAPGVNIYSERPHTTELFSDDFESGLGKWTVQSGPWGTRNVIGSTWLTDSPGANYADNADVAIRTASKIDAGASANCALKFTYGTFLENGFDWLYVQSSTDGTAWTDLKRIGDTAGSVKGGGVGLVAPGSRYYRFRLTSDADVNADGVYVDNLRLGCQGGAYGAGDFQYLQGTSMATPHVAGAAVVLFSAKPSATVAQVKAALLSTGDPVAALAGKTVSGRRLNLNAALQAPALKADTLTAIGVQHPDPSVVGQAVTFHYGVVGEVLSNSAPATGTVTVSDGTQSCSSTAFAGQCTLVFTTAGSRTMTASYGGDAYDNPSPPSLGVAHEVNRADTAVTIEDADDPSPAGATATVKFTVAAVAPGAGTPTGTVRVSDGVDDCTASVATGACDITLTTGGGRTLTATYSGDANFNGSAASEPHAVTRFATTTAVTADDPDPSEAGHAVTVRFAVTAAAGTPAGAVTVSDGVDSCTGTVAAGACAITLTTTGARALTATYAGDSRFAASASAPEPHTVKATVANPSVKPSGEAQAARVSGARASHARFRRSAKPQLAKASAVPVGTTFSYVLDKAATVRFDFIQPQRGRAKPKRRGSLTFAGHAGRNAVAFKGWLSRTNKLAPGTYTLIVTALTPGAGETSQQLRFTIVR